jgi:hypothetical protein
MWTYERELRDEPRILHNKHLHVHFAMYYYSNLNSDVEVDGTWITKTVLEMSEEY